jgi:hypothetical protein
MMARKTLRPIRPNPLIATLTDIGILLDGTTGNRQGWCAGGVFFRRPDNSRLRRRLPGPEWNPRAARLDGLALGGGVAATNPGDPVQFGAKRHDQEVITAGEG